MQNVWFAFTDSDRHLIFFFRRSDGRYGFKNISNSTVSSNENWFALSTNTVLGDDHLILRGGGGLALFGNKYSDLENAGNK